MLVTHRWSVFLLIYLEKVAIIDGYFHLLSTNWDRNGGIWNICVIQHVVYRSEISQLDLELCETLLHYVLLRTLMV